MWFSRLNSRISHSEVDSLLRRVFANCTAANPPPTMTTLIACMLSLLWPWPVRNLMSPLHQLDFSPLLRNKHFGKGEGVNPTRTTASMFRLQFRLACAFDSCD